MKFYSFTKTSDSFKHNVLKLITGTALAQAIGLLIMPVITRIFDPGAFGIAALFSSITGIIGVIVCLRYELAIMLPDTDQKAANILIISICSAIFLTILSGLFVFWGSDYIAEILHAPELKKYLWLLPIATIFQGIYLALSYWNNRTKHFGRLAIVQIISSVTTQVTRLAAGLFGFVSGGIIIGTTILGSLVSAIVLGAKVWRHDGNLFKTGIKLKIITDGFSRYKKFAIIDSWGALLNSISWQLPALMLAVFFSTTIVGYYALGLTIIKAPLNLITGSVSQVFYQKASIDKKIVGSNSELVEKLMARLIFMGLLPAMVLSLLGEEIFSILFGQRWFEAGRYVQILSPWLFFWFISSPLSMLFSVNEKQGWSFLVHLTIFITRVLSLYIGGIFQNIYMALGLFSVTGIAVYGWMAMCNIRLAHADAKKIIQLFIKYFLYALPVLICIFLTKYVFHINAIIILSSASIMMILYFAILGKKYYSAGLG